MIVIIIPTLKFQLNASVGVIPARNTTLFKLHLLANPAHFWLRISELLLKMTFSLLCSRNLIPLREISRVNPIKIVPSVSIRSNLFEENSCKIFNDVLQVKKDLLTTYFWKNVASTWWWFTFFNFNLFLEFNNFYDQPGKSNIHYIINCN